MLEHQTDNVVLTNVFSSHHRHQPYLVLQVDIRQTHCQAVALHNWRPWMREHYPIAYWRCRQDHDRAPTCLLKQPQRTQKHRRDQHRNWVPRNLWRRYNSFSIGLLKWNPRWKGIKKISIGELHGIMVTRWITHRSLYISGTTLVSYLSTANHATISWKIWRIHRNSLMIWATNMDLWKCALDLFNQHARSSWMNRYIWYTHVIHPWM